MVLSEKNSLSVRYSPGYLLYFKNSLTSEEFFSVSVLAMDFSLRSRPEKAANPTLVKHADHRNNRISQMQSETYHAIKALPDHLEVIAELKRRRFHSLAAQEEYWVEDQDFLRQLSTLDFTAMQKEVYSSRYASTGQWLLESSEFQVWLKSEANPPSVLWYQGDPGVGKTVATSMAVNYVTEQTVGRATAITYVYCDYANALTFSVVNLLGSMVRQLVVQTSHAGTIAELKNFLRSTARNRCMTEEDCSLWIETLSRNFDVVYTFVDALDECPEDERNKLLRGLQRYSRGSMRVFLTSRSSVDVKAHVPSAIKAVIAATREDITTYVQSKIHDSGRLARLIDRNPELEWHIVNTICDQAKGMIFLARLQVESLGFQTSARGVWSALERLPTDFFTMYDQAMERIRGQPKGDAALGWRVLSMIFGAVRPLSIDELRHALALKPGDTLLDIQALTDVETLFSVTAGLVTNYTDQKGKESCRFVHYTLQEYFESNRERLFPDLDLIMARVCLSYLSLDEFRTGWLSFGLVPKRMRDFCFYKYASQQWDFHLRVVQRELMDQSLAFVQDDMKTTAWLQCVGGKGIGLSSDKDTPLDPAFLAAHFHLAELFTRLISGRDIDIRNDWEETPLIRAVDVKPWQKGGQHKPSPFDDFGDEETWPRDKEPWFIRSLDADQQAMVHMILDLNANIDAKDLRGMTAAFHAVKNNNCGMLSLLLDRGASIDARMGTGESLLHIAAKNERTLGTLQILLDRSANVNALTKNGESAVHFAAKCYTSVVLDRLVEYGANIDVADKGGVTPLLVAASHGKSETLMALINLGANRDVTDWTGRTPLDHAYDFYHRWMLSSLCSDSGSPDDVVRLFTELGASETTIDASGRLRRRDTKYDWPLREEEHQWACTYQSKDSSGTLEDLHEDDESGERSEKDEDTREEGRESDRLDDHTDQVSINTTLPWPYDF